MKPVEVRFYCGDCATIDGYISTSFEQIDPAQPPQTHTWGVRLFHLLKVEDGIVFYMED